VNKLGSKDSGGLNIYLREISKELTTKGLIVDIFTRKHDIRDPQEIAINNNAKVVHLSAGDLSENKHNMHNYINLFTTNLLNYIDQHNLQYDLIYSNYWMSGMVGELISEKLKIPHIITFHTMGLTKRIVNYLEDESDFRIDNELNLIKTTDAIVVPTYQEKENLILNYKSENNIYIVAPGVDLEKFKSKNKLESREKLRLSQNIKILLSVGRLEPLKGYDMLINALSLLNTNDDFDVRLLIIGGDSKSEKELIRLNSLILKLGLSNQVNLLGAIEHDELPLYFSAADVFVMPSAYETFGIAALEASACNLPVIAPQVGGLKSVVKHAQTGFLSADRCPESLMHYLEILLKNQPLREQFGVNSRLHAMNYSWEKSSKDLISVFENVLSKCLA
jgi:D-inositol-3-phosphate glycosyltransferase